MSENNDLPVVIIGAGYTGLSAAHVLSKNGHKVKIIEEDLSAGGLAGTFEISPGFWVEKFYHHWFTSDTDVLDFIGELGLSDSIQFKGSNTGLYYANSIFRLSSPLDLLKFTPLPLLDRIRVGLMAVYARKINDYTKLEHISAKDWIRKVGGEKAFKVIWEPLLHGKFGEEAENVSAVWFWNKLKLRGSSRNDKGSESLAYYKGGFHSVTEAMVSALNKNGVTIEFNTKAKNIFSENGRIKSILTDKGEIFCKSALATIPLPLFLKIAPNEIGEKYTKKSRQIRFLGNVCLVLRLRKSLSNTYWLNVADPNFPFVGIIEHTNFDSKENYGGEHIAYLSKYLPVTDKMFQMSDSELYDYSIPYIQKMFPDFDSKEFVIGYKVWRANYSQPVITKHYSDLIPPFNTEVEGLWACNMAQIYPEDRGTNYAVKYGKKVALEMNEALRNGK